MTSPCRAIKHRAACGHCWRGSRKGKSNARQYHGMRFHNCVHGSGASPNGRAWWIRPYARRIHGPGAWFSSGAVRGQSTKLPLHPPCTRLPKHQRAIVATAVLHVRLPATGSIDRPTPVRREHWRGLRDALAIFTASCRLFLASSLASDPGPRKRISALCPRR